MSVSYFPVNYFKYSIYGIEVNTANPVSEQLYPILCRIGEGIGEKLDIKNIQVYPNDNSVTVPPTIELNYQSISSDYISGTSKVLLDLQIRIIVRLEIWSADSADPIYSAISEMTRYVTGNSFQGSCIAERSRLIKVAFEKKETGKFEITGIISARAMI